MGGHRSWIETLTDVPHVVIVVSTEVRLQPSTSVHKKVIICRAWGNEARYHKTVKDCGAREKFFDERRERTYVYCRNLIRRLCGRTCAAASEPTRHTTV